jgi:DNA-binding PadR family transcriptional regulator
MFELNGFQRDLLYCIAGLGGSYGLGIKRAVEDYGDTEINHGRLYPSLDTLVEKGYVAKSSIDDRTNAYELTPEGRALLADRHEREAAQLSKDDNE